jgi:hypothetical protein
LANLLRSSRIGRPKEVGLGKVWLVARLRTIADEDEAGGMKEFAVLFRRRTDEIEAGRIRVGK